MLSPIWLDEESELWEWYDHMCYTYQNDREIDSAEEVAICLISLLTRLNIVRIIYAG